MTDRYEAAWCPGFDTDFGPDNSLEIAYKWLADAERRLGGRGILVMNAASMRRNRPLLETAPWEIVSRRTQPPSDVGPVLAVYPSAKTLELAEVLARGSALCVIGGSTFDVAPWIRRTGASCLVAGFGVAEQMTLPAEVTKSLDSMLFNGGHNAFLGGGEKEDAIRELTRISRRLDAPPREAIEEYLYSTGMTDAEGVRRAGKWYDEIQQGKRHRDYRGQVIRG
ncbi:MAG: hypothetical protein ABSB75_00415 [Candidatus Limnocylindrales bacterium]